MADEEEEFYGGFLEMFTPKVLPDELGECLEYPDYKNSNLAFIPLSAYKTDELKRDAARTILAAGVDNNIGVYDSDGAGFFKKRLLALLKTVIYKNSFRKLTDLFILDDMKESVLCDLDIESALCDESPIYDDFYINKPVIIFGVEFHFVPNKNMRELEKYYKNELLGGFADGCSNLVVGLHVDETLVHSIYKDKSSLAVLNSKNVILGCY